MRLDNLPLQGCEVSEIDSTAEWREAFDRLAGAADYTLVVAPEFDGILRHTLRRVHEAGGRSLNAMDDFVAIASNKHRTGARLASAGVPTPEARLVEADEPKLPLDFTYPAVLKPVDGAGSQNTLLVHGPGDEPPPYPWPRRLERYCPGRAASVAALCGPSMRSSLPPCWQRISDDGRFAYRGGSIIREASFAARAAELAARAFDAMPPAHGFVGVDLVLGDESRGRDDFVIEINPRPTTSYVGLRAAIPQNLAKAMIDVIQGRTVELTPGTAPIEFDAAGAVWRP
jgi:predicted ATP-grasp superfamily ATP-dependent carboligase